MIFKTQRMLSNAKTKTIRVIIILTILISLMKYFIVSAQNNSDTIKIIYLPDLNLYPTPLVRPKEKDILEKSFGFLIYESQAIFQDIIRFINQKINFDILVFGGNNIKDRTSLHLLLDMASEIKGGVLFLVDKNEMQLSASNELLKENKLLGADFQSGNAWWSYKIKNYLLIGLNYDPQRKKQIEWLKEILLKNKNYATVLFLHDPLIDSNKNFIKTKAANEIISLVNINPQVKLVISSGGYLNRIKPSNNAVFLLSSSPIVYPCAVKLIELSESKIKIKMLNISLKGIIKKSGESLIGSKLALNLFPESQKSIKSYVLGSRSDLNFEIDFKDLKK